MLKIRTFLIIVLLIALLPLLVLDFYNYQSNLLVRRQIILDRNLEIANSVAVGFRAFILQQVQTEEAGGLAILHGGFTPPEATAFLHELRARNLHLSSISYATPSGKTVARTSSAPNIIPRQNLESVRRGRAWAVSALHRTDDGLYRAEFHVTTAVRTGGKIRALVDGVISDRFVFDFIKIRIGRRGNIGIVDKNGRAVALSFRKDLTWADRDRSFIAGIRSALRGRPTTMIAFHDRLGNIDRMGASTPIKQLGWVANVFQPVEEVLGPVRAQGLTEAGQFLAVSIAALAVVLVLAQMITRPITELAAHTEHFRSGRYGHRLPTDFTIAEIQALAQAMNAAATETQRRFEIEQHIAGTLQASLLPIEAPGFPGYDIGTRYASATEQALVGGDFYDFILLSPRKVAIVIGDVQGKGIEAAVTTVTTKFAVRDLAPRHKSPADVVHILNKICQRELSLEQFITMVYLVLDLRTGDISYAGAGHHPPIICGPGGCREFTENGPALGIYEDAQYAVGTARLEPGEALALYTDGIVEARTGANLFGLERVEEIVTENIEAQAQLICELVYSRAVDFSGQKLHDDLALVVIKRLPG